MFGGFGMTELLVILAIVLLIFGPKRIKSLGSDLGSAIKGFHNEIEILVDVGHHADAGWADFNKKGKDNRKH